MKKYLQSCCACIPQRFLLVFFIITGFTVGYLMRTSLSLALTEMTFRLPQEKNSEAQYCGSFDKKNTTVEQNKAEFYWSEELQQSLISAFFIGYILAHLPAGLLADWLGGKHMLGAGILLSALFTFLSPVMARWHYYALYTCRIFIGFGQGVMFPCTSSLVAKWAPPNERAIISGFVQSGVMFGNALSLILSGVILEAARNWDTLFYIFAAVGVIWSLGWFTLCYNTPAFHPFVTEKERTMIQTQISVTTKEKPKTTPWKKILTSPPFLSLVSINFGHSWAVFTMVNQIPFYTSKVLNYNIKESGITSALPNIAMIFTAIGVGFLADFLVKRKITSVTFNRRFFGVLANNLPIPFLIGASLAGCRGNLVIGLLVCMMFFKGAAYSSTRANPIDLSPNYAGLLMGVVNGSGAISGYLGPFFTSMIVTGDGSIQEWRYVFILTGSVMFASSIPFLFFGSGETQPWNNVADTTTQQPTENDSEPKKTASSKAPQENSEKA